MTVHHLKKRPYYPSATKQFTGGHVAHITAIVFMLLLGISVIAQIFSSYAVIWTGGLLIFTLVLIPYMWQAQYDVFSPIFSILLTTFWGVFVRSFYIAFGFPDFSTIQSFFLLGRTPDDFIFPILVMFVGVVSLFAGYLLKSINPAKKHQKISAKIEWHSERLTIGIVLLVIISWLALWQFVVNTGGLQLDFISTKRTVIKSVNSISDYRGYGYLQWLNSFSATAYILFFGWVVFHKKRFSPLSIALLSLLFINSLLLPIYNTNRAPIMWLIIYSLVMAYYARRSINIRLLMTVGILGLIGFQMLTGLRSTKNLEITDIFRMVDFNVFDSFVFDYNFLDLSKTVHIIQSVPSKMDFQWGSTLYGWIFTPIPRDIWPDKPLLYPGPMISYYIYNRSISGGIPPGIFAEMYMNFGLIGVVLGCFLFGYLIHSVYQFLNPRLTKNCNHIIIYAVSVLPFTFITVSDSFSQGVVITSLQLVQILIALHFITKRN